MYLSCGNRGTCVCASGFSNLNGNYEDGCEAETPGTVMKSKQCEPKPVSTTSGPEMTTTTKPVTTSGVNLMTTSKASTSENSGKDVTTTTTSSTTSEAKTTSTTKATTSTTTKTEVPKLCGSCRRQSDCGIRSQSHMVCGNKRRCICEDFWVDQNGNSQDGCEKLELNFRVDQNQCDFVPTITTTTRPTTSTTTMTTTKVTTTTKATSTTTRTTTTKSTTTTISTTTKSTTTTVTTTTKSTTTTVTTTTKSTTTTLTTTTTKPATTLFQTQPATVALQLCKPCNSQSDCGNKDTHMICGNRGRCVCEDFWIDTNGNPFDGCEVLDLDFRVIDTQCDDTPVPTVAQATTRSTTTTTTKTTKLTTTTSTTTTTTTQSTTTTSQAEGNFIDETTLVMAQLIEEIEEIPTSCPTEWIPKKSRKNRKNQKSISPVPSNLEVDTDGLTDGKKCQAKFLQACTAVPFSEAVKDHCNAVELTQQFFHIVNEISKLAVSGDGDRRCVFSLRLVDCEKLDFTKASRSDQFVKKLVSLSKHLFSNCGKGSLENALGKEIKALKKNHDDRSCSVRELEISATPKPTKGPKYSGKYCPIRTFATKSVPIFEARAFEIADAVAARSLFSRVAKEISRQGKKAAAGNLNSDQPSCDVPKLQAPCELVNLPKRESACQLVERFQSLYFFVADNCNENWTKRYSPVVENLYKASRPENGSECPPLGVELQQDAIKNFSEQYEALFNQTLRENLVQGRKANRELNMEQRQQKRLQNAQARLEREKNNAQDGNKNIKTLTIKYNKIIR